MGERDKHYSTKASPSVWQEQGLSLRGVVYMIEQVHYVWRNFKETRCGKLFNLLLLFVTFGGSTMQDDSLSLQEE